MPVPQFPLAVFVADENGNPIPNASVQIWVGDKCFAKATKTAVDDRDTYQATLPSGLPPFDLLVVREGRVIYEKRNLRPDIARVFFPEDTAGIAAGRPVRREKIWPILSMQLRMERVPTSIYHLLAHEQHPLVTTEVKNPSAAIGRRLLVKAQIEGYSDESLDELDLVNPGETRQSRLLPTMHLAKLKDVKTSIKATVTVALQDMESGAVLRREQKNVWLLPRMTVPLAIRDPASDTWTDTTRYVAAYVTPHNDEVLKLVRDASALKDGILPGYQSNSAQVKDQMEALFTIFKLRKINYTSNTLAFGDDEASVQNVKLPRETLTSELANCLDGVVLFASALEAMGLNSALVFIQEPDGGHALIGCEVSPNTGQWHYLDTTQINKCTFEDASSSALSLAQSFEKGAQELNEPRMFRRWPYKPDVKAGVIVPVE